MVEEFFLEIVLVLVLEVTTSLTFFFFVFLLPLSGVASPLQEIRITIQQKNVPLSKVFKEIEEKTDCSFLIRNNDVNTNEKVSIDAKNKTVAEIWKKLSLVLLSL